VSRMRQSALVLSSVGVLSLLTVMAGAASAAPAGGTRGDPQPEAAPFKIGPADSAGSAAIDSNGTIVTAYNDGDSDTVICVLPRGRRDCSHKANLTAPGSPDVFGVPQVFSPAAGHVDVLQETTETTYFYSSADGGITFSAPVNVGDLSVTAAALVGGDIVFGSGDNHDGAETEGISISAPAAPATIATPNTSVAYDYGVGSYKDGALVASDYDGSSYTTHVDYAPSGANFNATSSYHSVGSFGSQQLIGISGDALLTQETGGKETVELRLFNGSGFGPEHAVPHTSGGGPEWFAVDQDPSGHVHVFSESTHYSPIYDLEEVSTANGGRTWSGAVSHGDAAVSDYFAIALDSRGTGLVLGTEPARGYPVLGGQGVSLKLKSARIGTGGHTTASGKGSPAGTGRVVGLQVERAGRWYTVATTHEKAGGSFSFTIKGSSAGSFEYRAVVGLLPGYLEYGYSAARKLTVS
jgi:hypothetical protein